MIDQSTVDELTADRRYATLSYALEETARVSDELKKMCKWVRPSRIYEDMIIKPREQAIKVLGVSNLAAKECTRLAPGHDWLVQCQPIGGGDLQFSCWYQNLLPYAYAMMCSESGFQAVGIDFESINAYFGTVMGFVSLGNDDEIFGKEDTDLFSDLHSTCCDVDPPQLMYVEAYNPCLCFVAMKQPKLFVDYLLEFNATAETARQSWHFGFVKEVAKRLGNKLKIEWPEK